MRAADITPLQSEKQRERKREGGRERGDGAGKPQMDKRVRQEQRNEQPITFFVTAVDCRLVALPLLSDPLYTNANTQ